MEKDMATKKKSIEGKKTKKSPKEKNAKTAATVEEQALPPATESSRSSNEEEPTAVSTLETVPLPASRGKAGVLGGPKDRGIKAEDKLALPTGKFFTQERVLSLNPKSFYCAMRWDYHILGKSPEEAKRWWANKKILVTNPANGAQVVVRAVDFGPHENTGLTISLSPGALEALGIQSEDEVEIAFADQKAPLGQV